MPANCHRMRPPAYRHSPPQAIASWLGFASCLMACHWTDPRRPHKHSGARPSAPRAVAFWRMCRTAVLMGNTRKRAIHLAQFLVHGPTFHSLAMWRHPRTDHAQYAWNRPELYQHIARVCERGRFDMLFFADLNYISDAYRSSLEPSLRFACQTPEHD